MSTLETSVKKHSPSAFNFLCNQYILEEEHFDNFEGTFGKFHQESYCARKLSIILSIFSFYKRIIFKLPTGNLTSTLEKRGYLISLLTVKLIFYLKLNRLCKG